MAELSRHLAIVVIQNLSTRCDVDGLFALRRGRAVGFCNISGARGCETDGTVGLADLEVALSKAGGDNSIQISIIRNKGDVGCLQVVKSGKHIIKLEAQFADLVVHQTERGCLTRESKLGRTLEL